MEKEQAYNVPLGGWALFACLMVISWDPLDVQGCILGVVLGLI